MLLNLDYQVYSGVLAKFSALGKNVKPSPWMMKYWGVPINWKFSNGLNSRSHPAIMLLYLVEQGFGFWNRWMPKTNGRLQHYRVHKTLGFKRVVLPLMPLLPKKLAGDYRQLVITTSDAQGNQSGLLEQVQENFIHLRGSKILQRSMVGLKTYVKAFVGRVMVSRNGQVERTPANSSRQSDN